MSTNRFFFRCGRCLFKFTADREGHTRPHVEACPVCARQYVECLGATKGVLALGVPCNDVCVFAESPTCSCSCGGKNHGSRLVIPVLRGVVDFNTGKFPTLEKARAQWDRWQRLLTAAKAGATGDGANLLRYALQDIGGSKAWPNREKMLRKVCEKLGVALPGVVGISSGGRGSSQVEAQNSLSPMARPGDLFAWGDKWAHISPQFRGHQFVTPEVRDASGRVLSPAFSFSPQ